MSIAYTITLQGDEELQTKLAQLKADGLPMELHSSISKAVADHVKEHLLRLDRERANPLGGKRSHFYWEAAKSVEGHPTTTGAEVTIDKMGLRQRWKGGDIHAIHGTYLTIPARTESYNVPAREFPGVLEFVKFRSGAKALVLTTPDSGPDDFIDDAGNVGTRKRRRKKRLVRGHGLVEYWLKETVHQNEDPSVLPTAEEVTEVASLAANEYFAENT